MPMYEAPCAGGDEWDPQHPGETFNDFLDRVDKAIHICEANCPTPAYRRCEAEAGPYVAEGVRAGQLYELGKPIKIPPREPLFALKRKKVCPCTNPFLGLADQVYCRWCRDVRRKGGGGMSDVDPSNGRSHRGRAA